MKTKAITTEDFVPLLRKHMALPEFKQCLALSCRMDMPNVQCHADWSAPKSLPMSKAAFIALLRSIGVRLPPVMTHLMVVADVTSIVRVEISSYLDMADETDKGTGSGS